MLLHVSSVKNVTSKEGKHFVIYQSLEGNSATEQGDTPTYKLGDRLVCDKSFYKGKTYVKVLGAI